MQVDNRDPETAAIEEMDNVAVIANLLRAHNLPASKAGNFWTAVKEPTPLCQSKGSCCSMTGHWAVQHELRAGYEVRGVWPTNGVYATVHPQQSTALQEAGGTRGGTHRKDKAAPNINAATPEDNRWCKPWEDSGWPKCSGSKPLPTDEGGP